MTETIQINEITQLYSSKTGKPYWQLLTNAGKFNYFNEKTVNEIKPNLGKWFTVEIEENGQYKNLTAILGLAESQVNSSFPVPQAPTKPTQINFVDKHEEERQRLIVRQSCLKVAVDMIDDKDMINVMINVLAIAEKLVNWVYESDKEDVKA